MAQLAEALRQGGQLSPRARIGRHIDTADRPRILVEENRGKSHVMRKLDQELIQELEEILYRCGWVGNFRLIPMGFAKGTPHTIGIRLKEPQRNGVLVHLHGKGGNDSNIEAILLKPPAFDYLQFFTTLKFAQEHGDDEEVLLQPRKIREEAMEIIPREPEAPRVLEAEESVQVEAVPRPNHVPNRGLISDPDSRQLLLEEILKFTNQEGLVPKTAILSVLIKEFKIHPNGTGIIVRALQTHQLLVKAPGKEELFRLVNPPNPVGTAISQVPEPPKELQESKALQPRSTLAAGIEQLERKAGIASRVRARLGKVEKELGETAALLASLTEHHKTLTAEKQRLEAKLAEPDIASASERFAELKRLIG